MEGRIKEKRKEGMEKKEWRERGKKVKKDRRE